MITTFQTIINTNQAEGISATDDLKMNNADTGSNSASATQSIIFSHYSDLGLPYIGDDGPWDLSALVGPGFP